MAAWKAWPIHNQQTIVLRSLCWFWNRFIRLSFGEVRASCQLAVVFASKFWWIFTATWLKTCHYDHDGCHQCRKNWFCSMATLFEPCRYLLKNKAGSLCHLSSMPCIEKAVPLKELLKTLEDCGEARLTSNKQACIWQMVLGLQYFEFEPEINYIFPLLHGRSTLASRITMSSWQWTLSSRRNVLSLAWRQHGQEKKRTRRENKGKNKGKNKRSHILLCFFWATPLEASAVTFGSSKIVRLCRWRGGSGQALTWSNKLKIIFATSS